MKCIVKIRFSSDIFRYKKLCVSLLSVLSSSLSEFILCFFSLKNTVGGTSFSVTVAVGGVALFFFGIFHDVFERL